MQVVPFVPDQSDRWERLVDTAPMATFLHTRCFLSYHGERFRDASVLVTDGDRVRGLMPAALDPTDPKRIVSHPGATYGGLIHDGWLNGERMRDVLAAICSYYADHGARVLVYKPVPHIYHRSPSADDVWAIRELGAKTVAEDLSCAIDLAGRRSPSTRRARSREKAHRAGVAVSDDAGFMAAFWSVLGSALDRRHSARPVHTLEEIERLRSRFPGEIKPVVGLLDGEVVAGAVLFKTRMVVHTQYLAASELGMRVSALDAVIEHCIEEAHAAGARYFDFGISPGEGRRGLNTDLYRFKAEFGGGGVVYEQYEQSLAGEVALV